MQFAVPQFTDVEDKLIGPLTLKQFLIFMAAGGVILFFYSLLKLSIFFFFFAIPVGILGLAMAFGKFNGRPLYGYTGAFISFVAKPQVRIFKREEPDVIISFKTEKKTETKQAISQESNTSSLKKIAILLDQKTAEEKELIEK
jgi:hypothetical protein